MGKIIDVCNDYDSSRHACLLCKRIFTKCINARLVRCNWVPKKINVKISQQKLFKGGDVN